MARRKKYQFGDVNAPQAKMQDFSGNLPNKDILHFLLTQQGQNLTNQYKNAGYSLKADDNNVIASRPVGDYKLPYPVQAFNALAQVTTGIANRVNDIKSGRNEYKQYLQSLQPVSSENYNEQGLNDLPIYTKFGGGGNWIQGAHLEKGRCTPGSPNYDCPPGSPQWRLAQTFKKHHGFHEAEYGLENCESGCGGVDHDYINEMMKSGGWISGAIKHPGRCAHPGDANCPKGSPQYNLAMRFKHGDLHKHQVGGTTYPRMTQEQMGQFNRFNQFVRDQGYGKSDKLNNQTFSRNLYDQFIKANNDVILPYDQMIPMAQQEQYYLKNDATDFAQRHNDPNANITMNNITPFDSMYGPKTNSYDFPNATLNTIHNGQLVGSKSLGLVQGTGAGLQAAGSSKYTIPKGSKLETLSDTSGATGQYYENASGDLVKYPYGGGPLTSEGAKEILRDGTVHGKKLTPAQRRYFGYIAGGGKPKSQYGMDENDVNDTPQIEAEEGEVYQTPQGDINKISDSAPTHEQGGVVINNAERVLENTSNIRKDKKSQHLLLSPQMASMLTGMEMKGSMSHAGAMDKAQEGIDNKRGKLNKKVEKNVDAIEKNPHDFYANNSLDFNLLMARSIPNPGDIFNTLFHHQEMVKAMHGIENPTTKAQVGIDNASRLHDTQGWQFMYTKGDKSYYRRPDGKVVTSNGPQMTDAQWKSYLANETPERKAQRLASYNHGYNYGYTVQPNPGIDIQHPIAQIADISPNFQVPNLDINDQTTITNSTPGNRLKIVNNPKSQFNEPLHWYDVAGPLMGLANDTRIPAKYNNAQFNQIRLKLQNPLPSLQEGQRDFNNVVASLPQNSQGYANTANLFARKYGIDNQLLGQYENANAQIKNQETMYNANVKDRQSQSDQQARAIFEDQRLGSIEAQRLQRRTDWDTLFQTLAQNHALNRNGNLVMQLFPAFDQNAQYNGYQVPFHAPLNTPNQFGEEGLPPDTSIITNTNAMGKKQYFIKGANNTLKEIKFKN